MNTTARTIATILVAVPAALGGRWVAGAAASEPASVAAQADLAALRARVDELDRSAARLREAVEQRAVVPVAAAPVQRERALTEDALAAAYERWRAANPEAVAAAEAPRRPTPTVFRAGENVDLADVPMMELVRTLTAGGLGDREAQELFERIRDAGRMDEYVAAIEALAEANPEDAELQVALGNAYLQKLFELGSTPEGGQYAFKADAAFDAALALDEHNWEARFIKAVSLSNWPAFLGKGPAAIENFEILIQQQEALPPRPEFATTYLFLGNVHQSAGDLEQALDVWRDGLRLFPDDEALRTAVEGASGR